MEAEDDLYGDLFAAPSEAPPVSSEAAVERAANVTTCGAPEHTKPLAAPPAPGLVQAFLEHDLNELRQALGQCKASFSNTKSQLEASKARNEQLEAERASLVRNISVLFRTATLELERKTAEIARLRQDLDKSRSSSTAVQCASIGDARASAQRGTHHNSSTAGGRMEPGSRADGQSCGDGRAAGSRSAAAGEGRTRLPEKEPPRSTTGPGDRKRERDSNGQHASPLAPSHNHNHDRNGHNTSTRPGSSEREVLHADKRPRAWMDRSVGRDRQTTEQHTGRSGRDENWR